MSQSLDLLFLKSGDKGLSGVKVLQREYFLKKIMSAEHRGFIARQDVNLLDMPSIAPLSMQVGTRTISITEAETSITIDDVTHVIDSCHVKETRFSPQSSTSVCLDSEAFRSSNIFEGPYPAWAGYGPILFLFNIDFFFGYCYTVYIFLTHDSIIHFSIFHAKLLRFSTVWVSQAAAKQRAGRAGRTRPGLPLPG